MSSQARIFMPTQHHTHYAVHSAQLDSHNYFHRGTTARIAKSVIIPLTFFQCAYTIIEIQSITK